jgi:protein phosphatase
MSQQPALPQAAPTTRLVVRAALRTDVGRVRAENQDFGTYTSPEEERASTPGGRLLIVADGMGGHRGGATASRLAGETVKAEYLESPSHDIAGILREALHRANTKIYQEAQSNLDLRGMGTTTSAMAVRNGHGWLAHVGDSRIYRVRGTAIEQLTDDHSLVATMVREGLLTPDEAETHPRRNVLQRSMGVAEEVDIDITGPFDVQEGDVFILCSDGLHGLVKSPELVEVAQLPIEQAADEFVKRALDRGAPDNVTVIVARIESEPIPPEEVNLLDETQPMGAAALDPSAFDETTLDPSERPTARPIPVPEIPPEPAPAELDPHEAPTRPVPVQRSSFGGVLTWFLVIALVAGAAWFFWSR